MCMTGFNYCELLELTFINSFCFLSYYCYAFSLILSTCFMQYSTSLFLLFSTPLPSPPLPSPPLPSPSGPFPLAENLLCLGAHLPLPGQCHNAAWLPAVPRPVCPRGGHHLHLPHSERATGGCPHHPLLARADATGRAVQRRCLCTLTGLAQRLLWYINYT